MIASVSSDRINAALKAAGLDAVEPGGFAIAERRAWSAAAFRSLAEEGRGVVAFWAEMPGRVLGLSTKDAFEPSDAPPLSAEFLLGDGTTLHVRQDAGAAWIHILRADPSGDGFVRRHAILCRGGRVALYDVWWADGGNGALAPRAARFVGFESEGETTDAR